MNKAVTLHTHYSFYRLLLLLLEKITRQQRHTSVSMNDCGVFCSSTRMPLDGAKDRSRRTKLGLFSSLTPFVFAVFLSGLL